MGVLFSLTGGLSIIEKSLHDATLMAISEINAAGGAKGMKINAIVEDGASDPKTYNEKASKLVIQDRVNKRIQFWTQDGKFIKQWTDIEFGRPSGFAILPDDTIYVSDSDGQSIKIIKDDKVLDAIGGLDGMRPHQITIDRFGALYVNDEPFRIVKKIVRKSTPDQAPK